ncbi:MAG: hypothetical protein IT294_15780 [Deltaproteobacteria bacterium]|nr:hypothetical protein [Deltaproteobacteria bacterium]
MASPASPLRQPARLRERGVPSTFRIGGAETVLARAVLAYLRLVARSVSWSWVDRGGRPLDGGDVDPRLAAMRRRETPALLSYYIADALGVATLALVHDGFLRWMRELRCIVDDTLAGRASAAIIGSLGGRFTVLPPSGAPERMHGVYEVIRAGDGCAFPVDGGGPYREVGTGVVALAASLGATIVPMAAALSPALSFAPQSRVRVPVPKGRLVVAMGDELRIGRAADRRAVAAELKGTIDALSAVARAAARSG